jgi:hypothetical protein
MSLNTTQIIHIVADVAMLMSITVYFMNENKKLVSQIDTLSKKVESQEERITKQDGVILEILKHLDNTKSSSFKEIVIEPSLPSPLPPGCCFISSNGNQVCSPIEEVEEEDDDDDEEEEEEEDVQQKKEEKQVETAIEPQITQVVFVVPPLEEKKKIEPSLVSKVEEIIEDEEIPPVVAASVSPIIDKKKRKRKKSKTSSSPNDIDKELENELNELLKEEQSL